MARLRGGRDYPRSLGEFQAWFGTDADCLDYPEWVRWPQGFACPECGISRGWRLGDGRIMCAALRAPDVGDGGDDLRPDADAADGVVHRVLAVRHGQGRDLGAEPAAVPGDRLLPDGVGDAGPAAVGARAPGPGPAGRAGRGGRDLYRRGGARAARRAGPGKKVLTGIAVEVREPKGIGRCRMALLADGSSASLHPSSPATSSRARR